MKNKEPVRVEIDDLGDFVNVINSALERPVEIRLVDSKDYDLSPSSLKKYTISELETVFERGVYYWYTPIDKK